MNSCTATKYNIYKCTVSLRSYTQGCTYAHVHIHVWHTTPTATCTLKGGILSQAYSMFVHIYIYCSLTRKGPWAEHLTSLPKRGVGALSTVSAFHHKRTPTSCLQWLEALEANNWTQNNIQRNHQRLWSRVLMAHSTLNCMMWWWAYCSSRLVSRLPWGCSPH